MTGGAGFIGSHIVDLLMASGLSVTVLDDFSTGFGKNLEQWMRNPRFQMINVDLSSPNLSDFKAQPAGLLFHFAANPEVRSAEENPLEYIQSHTRMNKQVLEFAIRCGSPDIILASSAAVYGDATVLPTPVNYEPLSPISVYGEMKLESELLLRGYCMDGKRRGLVLRYGNIIGPRGRHGIVHDLLKRLERGRSVLDVLGDGSQRRSFLYIDDCVSSTAAALMSQLSSSETYQTFNVGNSDAVTVSEVARIVTGVIGEPDLDLEFKPGTADGKGWKGDLKQIHLDITGLRKLGWEPNHSSRESVRLTAEALWSDIKSNHV